MKNMILQVKNSNEPIRRSFIIAVLFLLCLTACEKKDPYVNPGDTPDPQWKITVDTTDMTASMTAIVKVAFAQSEGTLAAFMGNDCCGIAQYIEGLYWLYLSPATNAQDVQLKFYSPNLKRIFVAKETFPFANDGQQGTVSHPFTPEWNVAQ